MKKLSALLFLLAALPWAPLSAQSQLSRTDLQRLYTRHAPTRVSVHDPSVVWDEASQQYYIFGSHRAQAKTRDLYHWTAISPAIPWGRVSASGAIQQLTSQFAFDTPQVKTVTKGGVAHTLPAFNAREWAAQTSTNYSIDGNLWAPDIIYNKVMKKWCQYLSINGDKWASSIVLLTADKIEGPYVYQAPVVVSGFNGTNTNDYHKTDLEIVLGAQSSLPARYNKGSQWGTTWPNNIDPCVFYDEQGKLWMTYGSWSGGIFALQLDETTGLRDYDVTYPLAGSGSNYTSDPYFGKKIAGGFYVSGEASYVQHIGDYYYLFMTYGGLDSKGGYEMEVFRSKNPDGPYTDPRGTSAIFSNYQMNYGLKASSVRGEKILGAYADWGYMATGKTGELSQGHNSAITDDKGRSFLVYHTRFNDGSEGHQVRVHQLFTTQSGWLAAAPFEFNGETATDDSIATRQRFPAAEVAGTYQVLLHKQKMDYANREVVRPETLSLNADGTVTGAYTGSWELVDGTSYINITVGGYTYQGVVVEQQLEPYALKAVAFSGVSNRGVALWGYKLHGSSQLAALVVGGRVPVNDGDRVSYSLDLTSFAGDTKVEWQSSRPDILSGTGEYHGDAMTADEQPVDLYMTLTAGDAQYCDTISVTVVRSTADYWTGAKAYYPFSQQPAANAFNTTQTAQLKRNGATALPTLAAAPGRSSQAVHTAFGANGSESYVQMPNALQGAALAEGFSVSFLTKRVDDNLWDALFAFYNAASGARLYLTGNAYLGYNNNAGNWTDLNYPDVATGHIGVGAWSLVTLTLSRAEGPKLYVDGSPKPFNTVKGSQGGTGITQMGQFSFSEVVDFVKSCPDMYLGYGSFWGSCDAWFDDLMVFDRVLSADDVAALNAAERIGHDFTGISNTRPNAHDARTESAVYNLQGQRVAASGGQASLARLPHGIYICNGKKFVVK